MLTKRQKQILEYIKKFIKAKGYSPSLEDIRRHFRLSTKSGIHDHLKALEEKGYITRAKNKARSIEILEAGKISELIRIPLFGNIAAGEPIDVIEENKEYIAVPKDKLPSYGEVYALKIVGNSMIDEDINDGDIILVKQQTTAENGQKVVALIDNHEATLKKFYKERGYIRLQPANKNIEPIILEQDVPISIQGIFIDVVRQGGINPNTKQEIKGPVVPAVNQQKQLFDKKIKIAKRYIKDADVILFNGDRLDLMGALPPKSVKLVVTSPPYNIGKEYEKRKELGIYLAEQEATIKEAVRILSDDGSICWQVGNHIAKDGEVFPLDALIYQIGKKFGLKLRNRIIWHFGHGLHCSKRFSGRHETILWFTKSDNYTFNLDSVRTPQKYPGKRNYKKGKKYGMLSGNPLGKNPSDIWEIPNVKSNHPEKTKHPCQFPIELIERLVLSMTNKNDIVLDPYAGVGSTLCAAVIHNRKAYGADIMKKYLDIAEERIKSAANGTLERRLMGTPVYQPNGNTKLEQIPEEFLKARNGLFGSR